MGTKISNRIIIEGDKVHRVGYRPFLLTKALRLGIKNFDAENGEENGKQIVIVSISGDENCVSKFIKFAQGHYPQHAEGCKVSDVRECTEEVMSIDEYQKILSAEQQESIVQGGLEIGDKIDTLRRETGQNFERMDEKYDAISKAMFATVEAIEKRNQILEMRMEKTEKNIESLLNILIQQKK